MSGAPAHPRRVFDELYREIAQRIESASAEIGALNVSHEEAKAQIGQMLQELHGFRSEFLAELSLLERHVEWDKLTVAFFGETNAGKSTIIESLRILLNEDTRQATLAEAGHDLGRFEEALSVQSARLSQAVDAVEQEQREAQQRFEAAQAEAMERFKQEQLDAVRQFEARQFAVLERIEHRGRQLAGILEAERSARFVRKIWLAGGMGLIAGSCLGVLALSVLQRSGV